MARSPDSPLVRVEFADSAPSGEDRAPYTTPSGADGQPPRGRLLAILSTIVVLLLMLTSQAGIPGVGSRAAKRPTPVVSRLFPSPDVDVGTNGLPVPGRIRHVVEAGRGRLALLSPTDESKPTVLVGSIDPTAWVLIPNDLPGKPVHLWATTTGTWALVEPTRNSFASEDRLRYSPPQLDTYELREDGGMVVAILSPAHEPIKLTGGANELVAHGSRIVLQTHDEFLFVVDGSSPLSLGSTAGVEAHVIAGLGILLVDSDGALEHRTIDGRRRSVELPEGVNRLLQFQPVGNTAMAVTGGDSVDVWLADEQWRWEKQPLPDLGDAFVGVWRGSGNSIVIDTAEHRFVFDGSTWSRATTEGVAPFVTDNGVLVAHVDGATLRQLELAPVPSR